MGAPTAAGSKGWIELYSFSFGAANPADIVGGGLSAGKVSLSDFSIGLGTDSVQMPHQIVVTKPTDASSPKLFGESASRVGLDLSIVFAPGGPGPRHTLKLRNAVIAGIMPHYPPRSGRGELTRYEILTLAFSEYEFNGVRNFPPQLISLVTAFTRAVR
jgi:hypothetical protein